MWHVGSQFPNQASNLHPLNWKRGALTMNLIFLSSLEMVIMVYISVLHSVDTATTLGSFNCFDLLTLPS